LIKKENYKITFYNKRRKTNTIYAEKKKSCASRKILCFLSVSDEEKSIKSDKD